MPFHVTQQLRDHIDSVMWSLNGGDNPYQEQFIQRVYDVKMILVFI